MKSMREISDLAFRVILAVITFGCASYSYALGDLALDGHEEVYLLTTDLDGDEQEEIWISAERWVNGVAGNIWYVYVATRSGYQRIDGMPVVRPDAFRIAEMNDQQVVLNIWRGGAGSSTVFGYRIENKSLVEYNMGDLQKGENDSPAVRSLLNEAAMLVPPIHSPAEVMRITAEIESKLAVVQKPLSVYPEPEFVALPSSPEITDGKVEGGNSQPAGRKSTSDLPADNRQTWFLVGAIIIALLTLLIFYFLLKSKSKRGS